MIIITYYTKRIFCLQINYGQSPLKHFNC